MKKYQFKDVLFMRKKSIITVEDEQQSPVGSIKLTKLSGCEQRHSFSFTIGENEVVKMGIKKRGITNLLVATYILYINGKKYILKDKVGNNLLYFCVDGQIEEENIRVEENWRGDMEVKVDGRQVAIVKGDKWSGETKVHINADDDSPLLLAITILMYFMYKIYNDEADFIENLIFD